jgi:hypothetical protein
MKEGKVKIYVATIQIKGSNKLEAITNIKANSEQEAISRAYELVGKIFYQVIQVKVVENDIFSAIRN